MPENCGIEERPEVDLSLFNLYDPIDQERAKEYLQRKQGEEQFSRKDLNLSNYDLDGISFLTEQKRKKRTRR